MRLMGGPRAFSALCLSTESRVAASCVTPFGTCPYTNVHRGKWCREEMCGHAPSMQEIKQKLQDLDDTSLDWTAK